MTNFSGGLVTIVESCIAARADTMRTNAPMTNATFFMARSLKHERR
jgi:hypothetical protein